MLGYTRHVLKMNTPLFRDRNPRPLLLLVLQSSARFLTTTEHKTLYDKISAPFLSHFRGLIPHRLPLKIPVLHAPLKKLLHLERNGVRYMAGA